MCGRFALSVLPGEIPDLLGVATPEGYRPRWNIAPDSPILVLRAGSAGPRAAMLRWGFLPPWAVEARDPGRQINARIETAAAKPVFRAAFLKGRCLVPADGFFEWQKQPKGPARPFFVRPRDARILTFAGIWRRNRLADGSLLDTVAILTRDADPALAPIHPRMPVVVPAALRARWLAAEPVDAPLREALAQPVDLEAVEVSRAVNDPRNDGPELVRPLAGDRPAPSSRLEDLGPRLL
ncbi:MAG: SOS response-associated peptidase [Geminicoccaceae bacterium]|nr:SOS response-associated peptidase [Geminicoccaceae bacterium]